MTRPIKLSGEQWAVLQLKIREKYPAGVLLIRTRMKAVLGFTTRIDRVYDQKAYDYKSTVYLDFFDESKRTMFLLKYSEFLTDDH